MNTIFLIFPDNIYQEVKSLKNSDVLIIEHPEYFKKFKYHKNKIVLHRASLKFYEDYLKKNIKSKISYIEIDDYSKQKLKKILSKYDKILSYYIPNKELKEELIKLSKNLSIDLEFLDNPQFLTKQSDLEKYKNKKTRFRFHNFYVSQRKKFKILLDKNNQPRGGKWSLDSENRERIKDLSILPKKYFKPKKNKFVQDALKFVEKEFKNNPGTTENFQFPVNFNDANKWLDDFLKNRFKFFGTYEDAILKDELILFHSLLSPILNIGLLTPDYVISSTLSYSTKNKIPLNSLEGFIRQIIGWREYVFIVYESIGQNQKKSNYFENKKRIPKTFWYGKTGIDPIDTTIQKALHYSYTHHIERLMIIGNFMLISEYKPDDIYKWFMEMFIDAYEWVMVPNVYGMSQYSDNGQMTTKPYISSSNYILKMSNFKKGPWTQKWDLLYHQFIKKNYPKLSKIPRLRLFIKK